MPHSQILAKERQDREAGITSQPRFTFKGLFSGNKIPVEHEGAAEDVEVRIAAVSKELGSMATHGAELPEPQTTEQAGQAPAQAVEFSVVPPADTKH